MPAYVSSLHTLASTLQSGVAVAVVLLLLAIGGFGFWFVKGRPAQDVDPAASWRMLMGVAAGIFVACIITAWRLQAPVEVAAARHRHLDVTPRIVVPAQSRPPAVEGLEPDPLPFLILVPLALLALGSGLVDAAGWQHFISLTSNVCIAALVCDAAYIGWAAFLMGWARHGG